MFQLKKKSPKWYEAYKPTLKDKIGTCFRNFIAYLVFDCKWLWLDWLIGNLAELEMTLPLIFDEELRTQLLIADTRYDAPDFTEPTIAEQLIPKDPLYCSGCPLARTSKIATFFYGKQCNGYCLYLGKGDFSFLRPTELLWDGCKECGVNADFDEFTDDDVENSLEL